MKNTIGSHVTLTIFGESHGPSIGVVLDGLCPGLPIETERIEHLLSLRRPSGKLSTARREPDPVQIQSGVFNAHTTGTPLCLLIPNEDMHSADYSQLTDKPRPGHADYTARAKYHGFSDYRGGGHFSGRLTAPLVAAGAIAMTALSRKGITLGTHVLKCAGIADRPFHDYAEDIQSLDQKSFAVLDEDAAAQMRSAISSAAEAGDSVGGVLQTAVIGLPAGLGEPWFDSLESLLSHAMFSIPAVKGIEFGDGFALAECKGSQANDAFRFEQGRVVTATNHNGGVNGGISNGMPLVFQTAIKPTPSIYLPQDTVDLSTGENTVLQIGGRHDPAIVHRAAVVQTALTAFVLMDAVAGRWGTDVFLQEGPL